MPVAVATPPFASPNFVRQLFQISIGHGVCCPAITDLPAVEGEMIDSPAPGTPIVVLVHLQTTTREWQAPRHTAITETMVLADGSNDLFRGVLNTTSLARLHLTGSVPTAGTPVALTDYRLLFKNNPGKKLKCTVFINRCHFLPKYCSPRIERQLRRDHTAAQLIPATTQQQSPHVVFFCASAVGRVSRDSLLTCTRPIHSTTTKGIARRPFFIAADPQ